LFYVLGSILIPVDAAEVESWRSHYYDARVKIFGLSLAILVVMVLCTIVLLDHPAYHPRRAIPAAMGLLFTVGLVSNRPAIHGAIVAGFGLLLVVAAMVFASPGSFGMAP
jgi:hypothetical protein